MATRTALRFVERGPQKRRILQMREEGGLLDRPWIDVQLESESESEVVHRKEREQRVLSGKIRKRR